MRLHRLELSAFLAFPGRESIDFDRLGEAGLFLLQGRTGAGKTSLLDAVCFAFYGEVPGVREEGARLRSDHAPPETPTEVTLEATLRGRRIRITRRPEQDRPKRVGEGTTTDPHTIRVVAIDPGGGERVLATRHDEARSELGDLLGMTRKQFCQVVLLPQDGFARFLRAGSDEREQLLRELFDVGRFASVEAWLKDCKHDAERTAGAAMAELRDAAARTQEAAGVEAPEDWEHEPERLAGWLEEQLVVAEAAGATAEGACRAADAARDAAARQLTAGVALAEAQVEYAAARTALAEWAAGADARATAAARLDAGRRAGPALAHIADLDARRAAEQEAEATLGEALAAAAGAGITGGPEVLPGFEALRIDAMQSLARDIRARAASARAVVPHERAVAREERALAQLEQRNAANAERRTTLAAAAQAADAARPALVAKVEAACAARDRVPDLATALQTARARAQAGAERDGHAAALVAARAELLAAREAAVAAAEAHRTLQQRRLDGIAAELAAALTDGEPCAVCGAPDHPHPAEPSADGLVDEAAVREGAAASQAADAQRDACADAVAKLDALLAAATAVAGDTPLDALTAAVAAAGAAHEGARTAAAGLPDAERAVAAHDRERVALDERLAAAERELSAGVTALELRTAELDRRRAEVAEARGDAPSIAAHLEALEASAGLAEAAAAALEVAERAAEEVRRARSAAHRAALDGGFAGLGELRAAALDAQELIELEAQVRDAEQEHARRAATAERADLRAAAAQDPPDVAALEAAAATAREAADVARHTFTLAGHRFESLKSLRGRLQAALAVAIPARDELAVAREVADLANGVSASNRLRMRLSAYVLAARLEEVATAATLRLQRMSGGRYALAHADDGAKGRTRGGLDLRVIDAWTGQARSPASLSGGETFQASLALALGLADVVTAEAGGARLETLFVDEGFGSLDDEGTLDEVLDVLDSLRDGGRAVGIVSHVAELRQRIPTQLRVEIGQTGSRVVSGSGSR